MAKKQKPQYPIIVEEEADYKTVQVGPDNVRRYLKGHGNVCPLPDCGGSVEGTGDQEWLEDEIAVGRRCDKCGATWDDFYQVSDISQVTIPKEAKQP